MQTSLRVLVRPCFQYENIKAIIALLFIFTNLHCMNAKEDNFTCKKYYSEEIQDTVYTIMNTPPECASCDNPDIEDAIQDALIKTPLDKDVYSHSFSLEVIIGKNGKTLIARILDEKTKSSLMHQKFIENIKQTVWKPAQCNGRIVVSRFVAPVSISIDSN